MNHIQYLLKGTFLLTAAGLLSRIAGFFYKIFLSRTIGAEQIGLFHLCMPVFAFCMAAATGGMQTAISRLTACYAAANRPRASRRVVLSALTFSLTLSCLGSLLLGLNARWIAEVFLAEPRCLPLLRMIAVSLPFGAVHACISGYFIGRRQILIPACAQIAEQLLRISAVLLFCQLLLRRELIPTASVMAVGQIAGELASSLFCTLCLLFYSRSHTNLQSNDSAVSPSVEETGSVRAFKQEIVSMLSISVPLSLNRMLLCVLQGIEAALLPQQLRLFGISSREALAMYGTLSGMALPLLLFPTALTGSVGTLLLPLLSEAQALDRKQQITAASRASFEGSLLLGLFCFCQFFLSGEALGNLLFDSRQAGQFIRSLALVCPFLYVNTTFSGVLNGLGRSTAASIHSTSGFLLRLAFVVLAVPAHGISGYFFGLLLSQLLTTTLSLLTLYRSGQFQCSLSELLIKPAALCTLTISSVLLLRALLPYLAEPGWSPLILCALLTTLIFLSLSVSIRFPALRR